jgi:hypothetical protein
MDRKTLEAFWLLGGTLAVFLLGVAALTWFMLGLLTGWSYAPSASAEKARGRRLVPAPSRV